MGKVRKLRKKYLAFVAKRNNENDDDYKPAIDDTVIDFKKDFNQHFDLESTCSISKSIKSFLSGQTMTKKNKQRLRHVLFLKKLQVSAETKQMKQKMQKKIDLKDDLPLLLASTKNKKEKLNRFKFENLNSSVRKSCPQKGSSKHRNLQMIRDVNLLQKLIEDELLTENPHSRIQICTLEKLSQECLPVKMNL